METPPVGRYDSDTEIAEPNDGVPTYAECYLDCETETVRAQLGVRGALKWSDDFDDSFGFSGSKSKSVSFDKAQLWYGDSALFDDEFELIIDVDGTFISGRVGIEVSEEEAEQIIENFGGGVWNYVE